MKAISPNKTKEGVAGAIFLGTFFQCVLCLIGKMSEGSYAIHMPLIDYFIIGVIGSTLAVLGDLIESFMKRCSNLKDSGTLLKEHGGILDRFDSFFICVFFIYWWSLEYVRFKASEEYSPDKVHILQFLRM